MLTIVVGFAAAVSYSTGGAPASVVAADLNADGKLDLATASVVGNVGVLLNLGDGTFAAAVNHKAAVATSLVAADLNGDGKPDLAAALLESSNVGVLLNLGNGSFAGAVNYSVGPKMRGPTGCEGQCAQSGAHLVTVADLNGDGKPDLAAANWPGNVGVLLNLGNGTFASAVSYGGGGMATSVAAADLNGDGRADLAAATSGGVGLLLNQGNGIFGAAGTYNAGLSPHSVVAADLNGDGTADLATYNSYGNDVSVLLTSCLP